MTLQELNALILDAERVLLRLQELGGGGSAIRDVQQLVSEIRSARRRLILDARQSVRAMDNEQQRVRREAELNELSVEIAALQNRFGGM